MVLWGELAFSLAGDWFFSISASIFLLLFASVSLFSFTWSFLRFTLRFCLSLPALPLSSGSKSLSRGGPRGMVKTQHWLKQWRRRRHQILLVMNGAHLRWMEDMSLNKMTSEWLVYTNTIKYILSLINTMMTLTLSSELPVLHKPICAPSKFPYDVCMQHTNIIRKLRRSRSAIVQNGDPSWKCQSHRDIYQCQHKFDSNCVQSHFYGHLWCNS